MANTLSRALTSPAFFAHAPQLSSRVAASTIAGSSSRMITISCATPVFLIQLAAQALHHLALALRQDPGFDFVDA
jgi:hypothetical protein